MREKECVFVVGVNGSGKSTFLKLAAGLLRPQSGRVLYHSKTRTGTTRIGYQQQDVKIANRLPISVKELIMMGRIETKNFFFTRNDKAKVEQCMEQVNIQNLARKNIHDLSRGQYQRVLIARLLASEPTVIIMDEPEQFLDAVSRDILISLIKRLSHSISFLISSHNFDFIFALAQRILCLTDPEKNKEDHKFLDFLHKQNSNVRIEHLCSNHGARYD